jgi:ribonuclease HI
MKQSSSLEIYTDGASRGNRGPAAYAFLFARGGVVTCEESAYIGMATNNTAEYRAIIAALSKAREITQGHIEVFSDSELVIRQITGRYRITKPHLSMLRFEIAELEQKFSSISFRNVPRENSLIRRCDQLCNETLDAL